MYYIVSSNSFVDFFYLWLVMFESTFQNFVSVITKWLIYCKFAITGSNWLYHLLTQPTCVHSSSKNLSLPCGFPLVVESLGFKRGFAEEENGYCAAEAISHVTTKGEILYHFLVQYREQLQQTKQDLGLRNSTIQQTTQLFLIWMIHCTLIQNRANGCPKIL